MPPCQSPLPCIMANQMARSLRKTMTSHEVRLWVCLRELRPQGLHFRRQVPRAGYILDFACLKARLAIEVDGSQHAREQAQERDRIRDAALAELGFTALRIWNTKIEANLDGVVETIIHYARESIG